MSLDNTKPSKQPTKDESQTSIVGGNSGLKTSAALKPPEHTLNCPRCDSPNTKFCYYNNYSLTQPRHFCKTCRRYWTKGGALRNVPIGGGCRKSKKTKSSSSRFINGDSSSSFDIGGLSLFSGLSPPAMDFQLGGLNHLSSSSSIMNFDSLGFNLPLIKQTQHPLHGFQEIGVSNNLASSIETLSSINQDLHWKLQQQRLAVLFGGSSDGSGGDGDDIGQQIGQQIDQQNQIVIDQSQAQKLQPILFQNLEIHKPSQDGDLRKDGGGLETEWFFDGSYTPVNVDPTVAIASTDGETARSYENGSINNWNNEIQGWNQFNQYSALP